MKKILFIVKKFSAIIFVVLIINLSTISIQASHPEDEHAAGTAFLVNSDGHMLTAEHVVSECTNITVVNDRGIKKSSAEVIAFDKDLDLAVIKTEIMQSSFFLFSEYEPYILDDVIMVGFPDPHEDTEDEDIRLKAFKGTVTASFEYDKLIELDIYASGGSSGSAVLNSQGDVIGQLVGVFIDEFDATTFDGDQISVRAEITIATSSLWVGWFLENNNIKYTYAENRRFEYLEDLIRVFEDATYYVKCDLPAEEK